MSADDAYIPTDLHFTINSVDLTDELEEVGLPQQWTDVELLSFGSGGNMESRNGIHSAMLTGRFHQSFAAAKVDATIAPLAGGEPVPFEIRPGTAMVSSTNPQRSGSCRINAYDPFGGVTPGAKAPVQFSWPVTGALTRGTS